MVGFVVEMETHATVTALITLFCFSSFFFFLLALFYSLVYWVYPAAPTTVYLSSCCFVRVSLTGFSSTRMVPHSNLCDNVASIVLCIICVLCLYFMFLFSCLACIVVFRYSARCHSTS